jgi:hypothetical protein
MIQFFKSRTNDHNRRATMSNLLAFLRNAGAASVPFLCFATQAVRAANVELDLPGDRFAINPQTGAVCVLTTAQNSVALYPILSSKGLTDGRIDRTVGKQPVDVICRDVAGKPTFIVACTGDKTIWILDAGTLSVVKTISVAHAPMSLGAAMDGKLACIFYGSAEGLGAIDLRDFKDHPDLTPARQGMATYQQICLSSDGHLIYSYSTRGSPTGRSVSSIEESASAPPVVKLLSYTHESIDRLHADPFGPYASFGHPYGQGADQYVASADLPIPPSCYLVKRPIIISSQQGTLYFYSYNTHKELATFPLHPNAAPNRRANIPGRANRGFFAPATAGETVLADERNDNVLVCSGASVQIVEMSRLDLPKEPLLGVWIDDITTFNPGVTSSLTIRKINPAESVELKDPKPGMAIARDTFTWTPTGSDVGAATITFRIVSGEFQRLQSFAVSVRRPEVDLPFNPMESVLTGDGNFALLLGQPAGDPQAPFGVPGGQNAPGSDLILVDVAHRSIVARRSLPKSIRAIAIDGQHAYGAATDSDAVYLYSLKDLSDEKKFFADSPVSRIVAAGGKLFTLSQQNNCSIYSLPDLKPLDPKPQNNMNRGYNPFAPPVMPVRNETGWETDGVLYDADMSHILGLKNPSGFSEVTSVGFNGQFPNNGQQFPTNWGLTVQGDRLMRPPSQNLGTIQGSGAVFLKDLPAVATLLVETAQNRNPMQQQQPRTTTAVLLFDLVSATRQFSVVLSDEVLQNQPYNPYGYPGQPNQPILTAPGRIVIVAQQKLYVLETASLDKTKFPYPPQLSCEPGVKIIDPAAPTVIGFSAAHLKAPVEYSLDPDVKGLEIDKTSGKLTVDGPALMNKAAEQMAQTIAQQMMYMQPGAGGWANQNPNGQPTRRTPQEVIDAQTAAAVAKFTAFTGKKPDGIPMLVRMNAVAMDAEQQKVTCETAAFLCVPTQKVMDLVAAHQAEQEANQKRMQEQQELQQQMYGNRRRLATQPSDFALQKQIDDLKSQIADLQKQNTELAAQNKMLKEMVLEQKKP